MKLKVTFSVLLTGTIMYMNFSNTEPYNFAYKFMIITNSYSLEDQKRGFDIKEKLINEYEYLCFDINEKYHKDIIKSHISDFKFEKDISSYYSNGQIVLRIGNGIGYVIKGNLRKTKCDDSVIDEKIYFFEIFK